MNANQARKELRKYASKEKAEILCRFFKTDPGQYGEGDVFIGVKVPETRKVAKLFQDMPLPETLKLLKSPIHEERLLALLLFVQDYSRSNGTAKASIVKTYLAHSRYVNNWDLIDLSAPKLLGDWLRKEDRAVLDRLARSDDLWERRMAIVATYAFIRENDFRDTLRIADMLLNDPEDLMHKAAGWMLREVGKRDLAALEGFLKKRYTRMPRTMLRYAIERFPEKKRLAYLKGKLDDRSRPSAVPAPDNF